MLRLSDRPHSRRDFLSIGSLALGGLSLPHLLAARAAAAELGDVVRDKSVVFLFMHGGPPQHETFDPKMDAPAGIRSEVGEVRTSLPGVTFGSTLEQLAKLAHKLTIVRSFKTGDGNHDIKPVVGRSTLGANMGSLYARVAGTNSPRTGLPTNVALFPRAVDPTTMERISNFGRFESTGTLGAGYGPFIPGGDSTVQQDMQLRLSRDRLDDRRSLLGSLDRIRRSIDAGGSLDGADRFRQQAFDTILSGAADAFDLSHEDPRTIERYDTSGLMRADQISTKWNNHKRYVDHVKSLGKLMLLARRLVEHGVGFVTVTTNFVWDMHADANNATMTEGMKYCGAPFDKAVSAFIEDIEARGLRDKVLLVCCGEMGRTPKVNGKGGRDHWGGLAPLMLYGGGLKMGQVVGQSTRDGGEPATEPVTIDHLLTTVMHTLLDPGQVRLMPGLPGDVLRTITGGEVIPGLV
jgi:hypothetical protein